MVSIKPPLELPRESERPAALFHKFCSSSTVHGTFFWAEASTIVGKLVWITVVVTGVVCSAVVINKSFSAWKANPVVTSVAQIPIEQVPFPSITVCPTGNTKFNYAEEVANKKGLDGGLLSRALLRLVKQVLSGMNPLHEGHCLAASCAAEAGEDQEECPELGDFDDFLADVERADDYDSFVAGLLSLDDAVDEEATLGSPDCRRLARHFLFLSGFKAEFDGNLDDVPPGSLLRLVYNNLITEDERIEFFDTFFDRRDFPELYGDDLGLDEDVFVPIPDLVEELTETGENAGRARSAVEQLGMSRELLRTMRTSLHPPHKMVPTAASRSTSKVSNAAFPYCYYQDKDDEGVKFGPYDERYCDSFQTSFNERGLCYTWNSPDLGFDPDVGDDAVKVRNVKGCGKKKGLSLIIDRQKLWTQPLFRQTKDKHFVVFVTVPGVVTHKVPFMVDSSYDGEHHFFVHGIHYITASDGFVAWNNENKFCYGPTTKNLTYFGFYTQDNCLLECRYKKIIARCGCAPWYLEEDSYRMCDREGNSCFQEAFDNYQEDLQDRVDCDCRSDCGGLHIFSSMSRYGFNDETATQPELWWDPRDRSGRLASYLMDEEHFLVDSFSKNITKLALNLSDVELADKRFHQDISILNFFFDTPIITQVKLEMKITVFDQISAIGGALGLFTGVSLISFVEIAYWVVRFLGSALQNSIFGDSRNRQNLVSPVGSGGVIAVDGVPVAQNNYIGGNFEKDYSTIYNPSVR